MSPLESWVCDIPIGSTVYNIVSGFDMLGCIVLDIIYNISELPYCIIVACGVKQSTVILRACSMATHFICDTIIISIIEMIDA